MYPGPIQANVRGGMNPASIQANAKGVELYPTPIQPIVQRLNFPS